MLFTLGVVCGRCVCVCVCVCVRTFAHALVSVHVCKCVCYGSVLPEVHTINFKS